MVTLFRRPLVPPQVPLARRVFALLPHFVGLKAPGCGVVTEEDVRLGRLVLVEEHTGGRVVGRIVSREEGASLRRQLERIAS